MQILSSIKSKIGGLITCVTSSHGNALTGGEEEVAIVTELTSTMLAAVIAELQNASRQVRGESWLFQGFPTRMVYLKHDIW